MGLTDFTPDKDDDNSGSNGGLPASLIGLPMGPQSTSGSPDDDAKALLINYNEKFSGTDATMFRDALIEQVLSVLISKNKPNAMLVGSAGVGKTRIVEDIARRIADDDTLIPDQLKDHTIYELPIGSLIAGTSYRGELEAKIKMVVDFATDPKNKAIVFIDEIHQVAGGSGSGSSAGETGRQIAQILKPALARGDMSVIGATTSTESRAMDDDPAFARRFTRLIVDELTVEQTREVLALLRPSLVAHYRHQIRVSDDVLAEVVTIAEENSRATQHRPDSAITLLDRAMADRVLEQKGLIVQAEKKGNTQLAQQLRSIGSVPLTHARVVSVAKRMMTGNAQRQDLDVPALQQSLRDRLQGQDDVIDMLTDRLARQELDLFPTKVPTTWMLAGASGVGKTETAKIIADQMTGTEPIILNMAEYHTAASVSKIIGAPAGYVGSDSNAELPFDTLESNPHRVILLDEFEKADRAVQRMFLSAFDEGYIRNAHGKTLDFSKALIICTTNAARDALTSKPVGFGSTTRRISHQSLNKALSEFFEPELLGRFSLIVGYNSIDEDAFRRIVASSYQRQRQRIVQAKPRVARILPDVMPDDQVDALTSRAYVDSQGARPANKAVRTWIEDQVMSAQQRQVVPTSAVSVTADQED